MSNTLAGQHIPAGRFRPVTPWSTRASLLPRSLCLRALFLRALFLTVSCATLAACGETYIETSATTAPPSVVATTIPAVDPNAPVADLLNEMTTLMLGLDFVISDGPDANAVMARIESLWDAAEPTVRSTALDSAPDFDQAMDLARTGVDRNRPADASKAYKILAAVSAAYLADHS